MVDEFIFLINEKRLRSRLKALRNFYKDIQLKGRSEIERGEIIMHLDYFSRIIRELGRRYGTETLIGDGLMHVRNDGTILYFCSRRCRVSNLSFDRDSRKLKWTAYYGKREKGR